MRGLPSSWSIFRKFGVQKKRPSETINSSQVLSFERLDDRRMLAPVTVNTLADLLDGNVSSISALVSSPGADGKISLREAIIAANADATVDAITFDSSLNGGRILLEHAHGQLEVNSSQSIDASIRPCRLTPDGQRHP